MQMAGSLGINATDALAAPGEAPAPAPAPPQAQPKGNSQ
jgi:hypothetical protein